MASAWEEIPYGQTIKTVTGRYYAAIASVGKDISLDTIKQYALKYGFLLGVLDDSPSYLKKNPDDSRRYIAAQGIAQHGGASLEWDAGLASFLVHANLVKAWQSDNATPPLPPWASGKVDLPPPPSASLKPTVFAFAGALVIGGGALLARRLKRA